MKYFGEYCWPPRPEAAVPPSMIANFEAKGFLGQSKKNGTCLVLVRRGGSLLAFGRHGQKQIASWQKPTAAVEEAVTRALPIGDAAFVGELLHSKVPGIRDTVYLHDVLAVAGEWLVGTRYLERLERLWRMFPGDLAKSNAHFVHTEKVWVATAITNEIKRFFDGLSSSEDEGIVLKNPHAALAMPLQCRANSPWQIKCRRPTKVYSF